MNIKSYLLRFWNFWPPFFFSGIKILNLSKDYRHILVKLKLRFWNSNYLGTQFGGSIFSMTDPFFMIMMIKNLGSDYVVWDKAAYIHYLRPGKTDLFAEFNISDEEIAQISKIVKEHGRMDWKREVEVKDAKGVVVAKVEKVISIKKRTIHTDLH